MLSVSIGLMGLRLLRTYCGRPDHAGMGAMSRLPALLGRSRLPARPIPARADGGGPTPIFETLACAYGGYDGLIGWAFEDHGGPVSTAWAALCAGLDAPDFIQMQAALDE